MKKVSLSITIIILAASLCSAADYPLMSFGMKTYSAGANDSFGDFYFDGSYNNAFVTMSQKLGKYFNLKGESDFVYKSSISKAEKLTDLHNFIISNKVSFSYKNKYVRLTAATKPIAASSKSEFYFKQLNYFGIKTFACKYLTIETIYQNQYMLRDGELMTHKLQCNFGWYFEKSKFMHFRGGLTIWLQNGIYDTGNVPALKKAAANMYCVIDFNKVGFEKAFKEIEDKFKDYDDFE